MLRENLHRKGLTAVCTHVPRLELGLIAQTQSRQNP